MSACLPCAQRPESRTSAEEILLYIHTNPLLCQRFLNITQPYLITCVKYFTKPIAADFGTPSPSPTWAWHTADWNAEPEWQMIRMCALEGASGPERFEGTCIWSCYQVVWGSQGGFTVTSRRFQSEVKRWLVSGSVPTVRGGRLPALDCDLCAQHGVLRRAAFSSDLAAQHKWERRDARTISFITGEARQHSSQKIKNKK